MRLNPSFQVAAEDYFFLLNKLYPEKATLSLVGDRYRLTKDERMVLFRGIASRDKAKSRRAKLSPVPILPEIFIDGYNVLLTLLNFRLGKFLFIGNDGYLRDAGGSHGRLVQEELFWEMGRDFFSFLKETQFQRVRVFLDAPVSHSALHAARIRDILEKNRLEGECVLCDSADYALKRSDPSCVASSDTAIVDALPGPFFDAARSYLENRYRPTFLDLSPLNEQ